MSKGKKIDVTYIESNIPVPVRVSYPIRDLKVGDSFTFPKSKRVSVQSRASRIKADTGREFTIKLMDDGQCRIWRTK